jgi:peptidoglycan/LPS O-acetylase OafA/YrhL
MTLDSPYQLPAQIPQLDRLRGLAILLVLIYHLALVFPPVSFLNGVALQGWMGVDLFFTISGFLITGILWDSRDGKRYFARFYGRRVLRIWPAYMMLLAFAFCIIPLSKLIVGGPFLRVPEEPLGIWPYLLLIQNIFAKSLKASLVLNVTWSLAVEEQFYLVWPTVIRHASRRSALPCLLAGVFLAPFLRFWAMHHGVSSIGTYYNALTHCDSLLCGSAAAIWLRSARPRRWTLLLTGSALLLVGLVLFVPIRPLHDASNQDWSPLVFTSAALISTGLLLVVLVSENTGSFLHRFLFMNRPLAFFGYISYSLYLYHAMFYRLATSELLLAKLDWSCQPNLIRWLMAITGLGLSILTAWLSRVTIESYALSKKSIFG